MLLAIQFPLADSRSFLDRASRTAKPVWPFPEPDTEFVRYFGIIRTRKAGGIAQWGSENENLICDAGHAVSFTGDLTYRAPAQSLALRRAFSRFYYDGYASGKLEVGLATKSRAQVKLSAAQMDALSSHVMKLPVKVRNPGGKRAEHSLAQAGKSLAGLYLAASTSQANKPGPPEAWHVIAGKPLLFVEVEPGEEVEAPRGARMVTLPDSYGFELFRHTVRVDGNTLPMWLLRPGAAGDAGKARILRLCLLRLHAEHECLRQVLRHLLSGQLSPKRRSGPSDALQAYFDHALKNIRSAEGKSQGQYAPEVVDLARATAERLDPGTTDTLIDMIERFDPRRHIKQIVGEYISETSQVQIFEGDMTIHNGDNITISGISNSVLNIKATVGDITQSINNLPGADQASKDELKRLIEQLSDALKKAPAQHAADAEAVAEAAKTAIDAANKDKPNPTTIKITGEGLKKAAENIKAVMPDVLSIATQIVGAIFKVVGIPL